MRHVRESISSGQVAVKYWEIIADSLSKAGWSWGWVSAVDGDGRTIWIAEAHRDDGKRFVVRTDEKLTAFVELELAIRRFLISGVKYSLYRSPVSESLGPKLKKSLPDAPEHCRETFAFDRRIIGRRINERK